MSHVVKAIQKSQQFSLVRLMCSYGKDIVRPIGPDLLMQNLKNASSAHNVFDLVSSHYNIMNSKHSMQALRSLFELQKNEKSGVSMNAILKHSDFVKLCKKLKSQSGVIELNETIEALKVMTFVGVPSGSIITQVLLQLVRQNINNLSLNHIMFLEFLLGQFKSSPMVEALKIALPIVFEINLPHKIDRNNLVHLTECLYYASRTNISNDSVQIIVNSLCNYNDEFDAKSAKSIIWSITDMDASDLFQPLLEKAINDFIVHLDSFSFNDMETTLSKLIHKYSNKYPFYYNEVFLDSCANHIMDNDMGFFNALYAVKKFIRVNHWNKHLLDYICKKIIENNEVLCSDLGNVYALVTFVSMTDYRPKQWAIIQDLLKNMKNMSSYVKRDILWIRFAASLCLLDIYKLDVLSKALNESYLETLFEKKFVFMSDIENYFTIWHSINLYKKEFVDLLPAKYSPAKVTKKMKDIQEFPLQGAIEKGVGGEEYVLSNLVSKLGHQIDHAILFRKGGYPIPVRKENIEYIEDIEIASDHQLVCILCIRPIFYTINNNIMRESVKFSLKVLEENGFLAVPISYEIWNNLEDFEKIPYIMQKIKTKVDSESSRTESVYI